MSTKSTTPQTPKDMKLNKGQSQTPPGSAGWISSAYDGVSVKNTYANPITNRVILYSDREGVYDSMLMCKSGVSNIDNSCMCPGSSNSTPFNFENPLMSRLFVPEQPGMSVEPTHAARCLMAARKPWQLSQPFEPYLGSCDK